MSAYRFLYRLRDGWKEGTRAFNDTLLDFAAVDPKRLITSAQVPIHDIDFAVQEVRRIAEAGGKSLQMPVFPHELGFADSFDERYDPLWNVIVEYDLPICCHIGLNTGLTGLAQRDPTPGKGVFVFNVGLSAGDALGMWLLTGVLERHPNLKVVFVEPGLAWVAWVLWAIDDMAERQGYEFPELKDKPSSYYYRNIHLTFIDEPFSIEKLRPELGVRNIMWSSDYPHPVSSWPHSRAGREDVRHGPERRARAHRERQRQARVEPVAGRFPDGFHWGTATAAHQIEGGNWNNDWWQWEHTPGSPCAESSGDACDSWNRWQDDVELVAELGFDNYRFSIEWSRIEPEEGEFSRAALDHYRRICDALLERGRRPGGHVPPLHDAAMAGGPGWLGASRRPPTRSPASASAAARRARRRDRHGRARSTSRTSSSYIGYRARRRSRRASATADVRAARERRASSPPTGGPSTRSAARARACRSASRCRWPTTRRSTAARRRVASAARVMEDVFLDATDGDDFIGVQTYTRTRIGPDGMLGTEPGVPVLRDGLRVLAGGARGDASAARGSDRRARPVLVTENGIGTDDDDQRIELRAARRSKVCCGASPTASTCAATRTGACSTTSSGRSGTGPGSVSRQSTGARSLAPPSPAPDGSATS